MVKKLAKTSVSEDDGDDLILNENGKRPADATSGESAKRVRTKSLYRQPTVRELNRLTETETLFNSNLFRLQVEEILEEVKVKEKTEKKFKEWYDTFKKHLDSISVPETEYDLSENTLYKDLKVKNPLSTELKKTKCMFTFYKYKQIDIVGAYSLGCPINSKLTVDVQVTVPAKTFTKNDSINYRYHKKRAAYLACIASHLKSYPEIEDLKYSFIDGNDSKPVLDMKPTGKLGTYLSVRLLLVCEAEAYKLQRFSPLRNNLREAWLFDLDNQENSELGPPTPYYNSSVLQDLTASTNHEFLSSVFLESDNLKQAVVLIKIWLRQRNLKVSGHIVSLFVAHLVKTKRVNNFMSSYQIVRNVWIALKSSEWDTKGLSIQSGESPPITDFLTNFPVVFLDCTGYYNICHNMCKGTYQALKRESDFAVEMLDNGEINSFIPLFMTPVESLMQFDHIVRFKNLQSSIEKVYAAASREEKLNYGVDRLRLVIDKIHALLIRGLGNRVHLIQELVDADFSWSVDKLLKKAKAESNFAGKLSFGLILNPENALNIVDKGPPANLPEAEEYRVFWGDKSELRRFQDGSITETCVWEGDSLSSRRALSTQIVDYLLKLKYGIDDAYHISTQLDSVLTIKEYLPSDGVMGTGEEVAVKTIQAFDELRRDLRNLTELPLEIASVYGTSPVLSYSAPLPPPLASYVATPAPWRRGGTCLIKGGQDSKDKGGCPPYVEPCEAVIEMSDLHQTHPAFGPTTCLVKRWLSAHLLDDYHFPSTVAELLTANIFIQSEPFKAPIQPLAGFLRVLKMLATHEWSREVVIVNFNKEMKPEDKSEIERKFNSRDVTTSPSMHLVTSLDGVSPGIWSHKAPTALVLARVKKLAISTLKYMELKLEGFEDNLLGAFLPSLAGYDAILRLSQRLTPYLAEQVNKKPALKRVVESDMDYLPVVGFNPVQKYLDELRSAYSDFALFFHDSYGGDVIAVLWKPNIGEALDFQVSTINGAKPIKVKGETKYKTNIAAILEDFKILGKGLVTEVVVGS